MLTNVTERNDSLEGNANHAIIQHHKLDNVSVIERFAYIA